jgi:uncharacterized membrane protein
MSTRTERTPVRLVLRLLAAAGWTVLAFVLYWICEGIFEGYPQAHSKLLVTLAMLAVALTGGIAWIVDDRRPHDDD